MASTRKPGLAPSGAAVKITTHGYPRCIALGSEVALLRTVIGTKTIAAKDPNLQAGPGGAEYLSSRHGVPYGFSRIVSRPIRPAKPDAASCNAVRSRAGSREDRISTSFQRLGLGSRKGALPHQLSSRVAGNPAWLSVLPTMPNLNGLAPRLSLELEAHLEGRACVFVLNHVSGSLSGATQVSRIDDFEIGELIVGGQERVRLTRALGLGDLHNGLPARPHSRRTLLSIGFPSVWYCGRKHHAAGKIAVVRDGQYLTTGVFLIGRHIVPEIFRVFRVKERER